MANGGRIEYTLGFKVDTSGLSQIDKAFEKLNKINSGTLIETGVAKNSEDAIKKINEMEKSAQKLKAVFKESFNSITGTTNIDKLNKGLKSLNLNKIYSDFRNIGASGTSAFRDIANASLRLNTSLMSTRTTLDKIGDTLKHSLKWQLSASAIQGTMSSIQEAYRYVVKLDTSLNNIQIVTQKSSDEMSRFAREANKAAQAMGAATTSYTDAALIFYQEGLSTKDAQTLADLTVKISNVTGESAEQVSQNVTAVVNGYQLAYQDAEQTMDKLAAVAASSASNLNELSTAMSKTAASANMVGMDVDKLTAAISTTISVTRQAPESVGTAYKTILARLGDLKLGETGEDGETLGSVSSDLQKLGVNILDTNGNLRDMGDIITEIGEKWQTWDTSTKQAAAISMAGKRQYTMLSALFDNWDRYNNMLSVEGSSLGTLQQQQDTYMESTAAKLQIMSTAIENVWDSFANNDTIEGFASAITNLANGIATFLDSVGGGNTVLMTLGAIGMRVFSKQISTGINTSLSKLKQMKDRAAEVQEKMKSLEKWEGIDNLDESTKKIIEMRKEAMKMAEFIPASQWEGVEEIINSAVIAANEYNEALERSADIAKTKTNAKNRLQEFYTAKDTKEKTGEQRIQDLIDAGVPLSNSNDDLAEYILKRRENFENIKTLTKNGTIDTKTLPNNVVQNFEAVRNSLLWKTDTGKLNKIIEDYSKTERSSKDAAKAIGLFNKELKNMYSRASEGVEAIDNFDRAITLTEEKVDELKARVDECGNAMSNVIDEAKNIKIGGDFLQILGGLGSIAMGLQQLSNLGDIWSQDDLSTGQKLLETIVNLSFAVPMVVSGVTGMAKAIKGLTEAEKEFVVIQTLVNIASGEEVVANTGKLIDLIKTKLSGAINAAIGAFKGFGKVLAGNPYAAVALGIAAIGAATYGLIKHMNHLKEAYVETVNNAPEEMARAVQNATTSYGDLINKINELDEKQKTIEGLTQGTREWTAAVMENNAEVQQLIEKYNLLSGSDYNLKNNIMTITEEGYSKMLKESSTRMAAAQAMYSSAEYGKNKNTINNAIEDLNKNINNNNKKIELKISDRLTDNRSQSELDFNNALKSLNNATTDTQQLDALNKINNVIAEHGQQLLDSNVITQDDINELTNVTTAINENISNRKLNDKQAVDLALSENDYYNSLSQQEKELFQNSVVDSAQNPYDILEINDLPAAAVAKGYGLGDKKIKYSADSNQKYMRQALSEMLGVDISEFTKIDTEDLNNGTIKLIFEDENGEEQNKTVVEDDFINAMALQASIDKIQNQQDFTNEKNTISTLSNLAEKKNIDTEAFISAILSSNGGSIDFNNSNLSYKDLSHLYNNNINESDLDDLGINEDYVKSLGFESVKSFLDLIQNGAENALENFGENYNIDDAINLLNKNNPGREARKSSRGNLVLTANNGDKVTYREGQLFEKGTNNIYNDEELLNEARDAVEKAKSLQDADTFEKNAIDYGASKEDIDNYTEALQDNHEALKDDEASARRMAATQAKLQTGTKKLSELFSNYNDALELKNGPEYATAIKKIQSEFAAMAGIEEDLLDKDFAEKHLDEIKKAAEGDTDALNNLLKTAGEESLGGIFKLDDDKITKQEQGIIDELIGIGNEIGDIEVGVDIRANLSDESKIKLQEDMTKMLVSGATDGQVEAALGNIYGADFEIDYIEVPYSSLGFDAEGNLSFSSNGSINDIFKTVAGLTQSGGNFNLAGAGNLGINANAKEEGIWKIPYIKSAKKAAPKVGNKTNKGSGGGGGGGKGKGGGKKNPKKKLGEGYNAYYKQEKALDKLQRVYDQLDKTSDRTFGLDKVKSIKAQNKNIVEQTKYLAQELDITRKIAKEYQTEGTKKFGFKFDSETGVITNYNDIVEKAREKYNKSNRGEKATEKFEELVQWAEDYESEVVSKLNEELDEMADKIDEFVENSLEKIDAYIEIHTDYSDLLETWQEFRRDIVNDIKDDDYLNLNKFALTNIKEIFDNGLLDTYVTESQKALEGILNIKNGGMDANYFNDEASALEHLKDGVEGIMEYWTNIKSLMDEAGDNYVSAIEKASDEISKQMDIYEAINSQYEHDMNVISSLYGEDSYRMQQAYTQAQVDNSSRSLDLARRNAKLMEEAYKDALARGNEEGIQTAKEKWIEAINGINDNVEKSIEDIINNYKTVIMASVEEMTKAFTSGFGTDILQDELNSIFANDEVLLDAVNRGYAIQDLASKWQSAIDGSSNIEVQERLNQLMQDQLGYLEEKGELTQYDIDRAEKEYEIALKQIALQEAQQNKSKMRLVRDANGNYTYKYTSDEDQIKKAQDELNKLQNELYNMDKEKIRTNLGDILGAYNDMYDELEKIAEDKRLGDEERYAKMFETAKNYYEKVGKLAAQNGFITSNLNSSSLLNGIDASSMQWFNQAMNNMGAIDTSLLDTDFKNVVNTVLNADNLRKEQINATLSEKDIQDLINGTDINAESLQNLLVDNKELVDQQKEQIMQTADYYSQVVELFNNANKLLQENSNLVEEVLKYAKIWSDETTGQETYSSAKKNGMVESGDAAQLNSDIKLGGFSVKSGTGVMIGDIQGSKAYIMTADNKVGWIDKDKLTGFDTGGYTGSWGKEGRLAMLHQKELVLNQQDTENMLNVVKATRDMVNNLKANSAATISNAIKSNYINGIGNESGIVEQDVRIEATFPNVQTATEIETALNNLINTASQRVMQNKK